MQPAIVLRNRLLLIVVCLLLLIQERSSRLHGRRAYAVHSKPPLSSDAARKSTAIQETTTTTQSTVAVPFTTVIMRAHKANRYNTKMTKLTYMTTLNVDAFGIQTTEAVPVKTKVEKEGDKEVEAETETEANRDDTATIESFSEVPTPTAKTFTEAPKTAAPTMSLIIESNTTIEATSEISILDVQKAFDRSQKLLPPVAKKVAGKVNEAPKTSVSNLVIEDIVVEDGDDYFGGKGEDDIQKSMLENATDLETDLVLVEAQKTLEQAVEQQSLQKEINAQISAEEFPGGPPITSATDRDLPELMADTMILSRQIELAAIDLMTLSAEGVNLIVPTTQTSIERRKENSTFTLRNVYVPASLRLVLPCSMAMVLQSPFSEFKWYRNKLLMKLRGSRVEIGEKKELIFAEVDPEDTGRYNCHRSTKKFVYTNLVYLRVFVPADMAVGFPFKFKAALCNTQEGLTIESQIRTIFCSAFQSCSTSFDFTTSCHVTPWFGQKKNRDPLPAILQVLVIKYTNANYQAPTCKTRCIMKAKLDNILSESLPLAQVFRQVGESVRRFGHCTSSVCPSDYVFIPQDTYTESTVLYVCDAGHAIYQIAACVPCLPGEFSTSRGWEEECKRCPVATYQPELGSDSCIPCKNRTVKYIKTGSTSADICPAAAVVGNSRKAMIGFICLVTILGVLALLIVVIIVMYIRDGASDKEAKAKPGRTTGSPAAIGEKEPLKSSTGLVSGKASTTPARNASGTAAGQRRAVDLSSTVSAKRVSLLRAQPAKSVPSFGRRPSRFSIAGRPSRTASTGTAPLPLNHPSDQPGRAGGSVHTQAAPLPLWVTERGTVTKISPLVPATARPSSTGERVDYSPTVVREVTPFVSHTAFSVGPESAMATQMGASNSDTSYRTAISTTPVGSGSRQTGQTTTTMPTNNSSHGISASSVTRPPVDAAPSAVSRVSFETPLSTLTPTVSGSRQTQQTTTTLPAGSSAATSYSTATRPPVDAVSRVSFETPMSTIPSTASGSRQNTAQNSATLPPYRTPSLSSSAAIKPSSVSEAMPRAPLWTNTPTVSGSRQTTVQNTASLPPYITPVQSSSVAAKTSVVDQPSQASFNSAMSATTSVSDSRQTSQTMSSLPSNTSITNASSAGTTIPIGAPNTTSRVLFKSPLESSTNMGTEIRPSELSTAFLQAYASLTRASSANPTLPTGAPASTSRVSFKSPLESSTTVGSEIRPPVPSTAPQPMNAAPAPSSSAATTPPVASASIAYPPVASMSTAAVPGQTSQNVNQSSRSQPSLTSGTTLGSAASDRSPSLAQLPLANESRRKPMDRRPNVLLDVLRARLEGQKTRSVASSMNFTASVDSNSSKPPIGSVGNLKSPITSPTVASKEPPNAGVLTTPPPVEYHERESDSQNLKSQGWVTASPDATSSDIKRVVTVNSPLLSTEKEELWNSYEATERDNLVDGADEELVSEETLSTLGTKKQTRKR